MNGRTQRAIGLCASLACLTTFATSVESQSYDFEKCNLAKCYFGTKFELVHSLADNFQDGIPLPDNICSQTVTPLVLSASLPTSCGSAYTGVREALHKKCNTPITDRAASCGSNPDDVLDYLIIYVIFYGVLIFFNYTKNHKASP